MWYSSALGHHITNSQSCYITPTRLKSQWLMLEHSTKQWHAARPAEAAVWTKCQGIVMQGVVLLAWQCPSTMLCTMLTASGDWTWRCSGFLHVVLLWIITFGPHREALIVLPCKWSVTAAVHMSLVSWSNLFFLRVNRFMWPAELSVLNKSICVGKWCYFTYLFHGAESILRSKLVCS